MQIHLHLGVHKTASTYLQNCLWRERKALNRKGIGLIGLGKLRALMTKPLMTLSPRTFRIEDHLDMFFEGNVPATVRGLIISDENLLGHCHTFINSGQLYRTGRRRLTQVRKLLTGHDVTLYMALRCYDAFTASVYCETLRFADQFMSFAEFRDRLNTDSMRWNGVVQRAVAALEPAAVKIWRYEDFQHNVPSILRAVAFDTAVGEPSAEKRNARASFSAAAVDILEALAPTFEPALVGRLINPVVDALPKSEANPGFDPWSVDEKRMFAEFYAADCAAVNANYWFEIPQAPMTSAAHPPRSTFFARLVG